MSVKVEFHRSVHLSKQGRFGATSTSRQDKLEPSLLPPIEGTHIMPYNTIVLLFRILLFNANM